ncbi:uncharacterized protein LOC143035208 isoform X2 [Oratosquilla oratoria]
MGSKFLRKFAIYAAPTTWQRCGNRCLSLSCSLHVPRGISRTLKALDLSEKEINSFTGEELEEITHLEMQHLDDLSDNHFKEVQQNQLKTQMKIIERKYFPHEKEVNLLTWAMKEQLRYLNALDPSTWTPEHLSVTFPVSTEGAKKLLKAKWFPRTESDVERHDRAVVRNWKKYTNGKLGSAALIEDTIGQGRNRAGMVSSALTSTEIPDQVLKRLEGLKFEGEEDIYVAKGLKPKNRLKKTPKFNIGNFSDIVKDYKKDLNIVNGNMEDPQENMGVPKCSDLSQVLWQGRHYQSKSTQVRCSSSGSLDKRVQRKDKGNKNRKEKERTFEEFMEKKRKS